MPANRTLDEIPSHKKLPEMLARTLYTDHGVIIKDDAIQQIKQFIYEELDLSPEQRKRAAEWLGEGYKLPGHEETMAGLDKLKINKGEK